jgi:hypothetical protein
MQMEEKYIQLRRTQGEGSGREGFFCVVTGNDFATVPLDVRMHTRGNRNKGFVRAEDVANIRRTNSPGPVHARCSVAVSLRQARVFPGSGTRTYVKN